MKRLTANSEPTRAPRTVETLAKDAVGESVLIVALPDDDETAARTGADRRGPLGAVGKRVDLELGADRASAAVEALGEDAVVVAVLRLALPCHDEGSVRVARDGGFVLVPLRVRVDLELAARGRAGAREPLPKDVVVRRGVSLVDDDEVAVRRPTEIGVLPDRTGKRGHFLLAVHGHARRVVELQEDVVGGGQGAHCRPAPGDHERRPRRSRRLRCGTGGRM